MSNSYYTHGTFPASNSQGSSAGMRGELSAIMAGFDLLPDPAGVGLKGFSDGTWTDPTIHNGTMDGTVIGDTAPVRAAFTTLLASGAVTFSAGGALAGTFAAGAAGKLTGFGISGGTIDNTPLGLTTRSSALFTTLGVSGIATLDGDVNVGGAFNLKTGQFELGTPANAGSPFMDFHSSGAGSDYDARITAAGGSATPGQGTLSLLASAIALSVRPTWNGGAVPWDNVSLPNPFQSVGGTLSGALTLQSGAGSTYSPVFTLNAAGTYHPNIRANATASTLEFVNSANSAINMSLSDAGALAVRAGATFGARPSWLGYTPWDSNNLTNLNQLANGPGYVTAGATVNNALHLNGWNWNFQSAGGTPPWLWGNGGDGNQYLYNPAGFSVNYANSANFANSAGSVGGVSNPATNGSQVQWNSGIYEIGPLAGNSTLRAGAPWVCVGWRTADSDYLRVNQGVGGQFLQFAWLRNQ